jgi:hypothetical protein
MTLDEFVKEAHEQVDRFKAAWLKAHEEAPEIYPLEFPAENDGLWWEFLQTHDST